MTIRSLLLGSSLALLALPALAQEAEHPLVGKVREIQEKVVRYRGLEFQAPVKVGVKQPAELRTMLVESFKEEAPVEEMAKQEKVLKTLGLIPRDFALRAKLLEFLSKQIGGYYDPEAKELFLVDRPAKGFLEAMSKGSNDEMVMAHELHHALQDQNFALDRWFSVLGDHEDRVQGYKSLIEGEAQLVGMAYLMGPQVDLKQLNSMQDMMLGVLPKEMLGESAEVLTLPPYLLENMMFPYTQGAEFVQDLQRKHGWEGVTAAFAAPPSSTEQVLHPERFYSRDEPVELRLPNLLGGIVGPGAQELWENTLGEFSTSVLLRALGLSKPAAARAAAGWDGDRFAGFESAEGQVVVVWLTTWDSEDEAEEFRAAYAPALAKHSPQAHLERRGTEVLLVDGAQDEQLEALVRRAFMSVKLEQTVTPLPEFMSKPLPSDFGGEGRAEAAPAVSTEPTLVRLDDLGLSFVLPPRFAGEEEAIDILRQFGSAPFLRADGVRLRVFALPLPLSAAIEQLEGLLEGTPDAEIHERGEGALHGRATLSLVFTAALPGDAAPTRTQLVAVSAGDRTAVLGLSTPPESDPPAMSDLVDSLWLDARVGPTPLPRGRHETSAGAIRVAQALDAHQAGEGPVFHTQRDDAGARIVVASVAAEGELRAYAQRFAPQLRRLAPGAQVHIGGLVKRAGRDAYEVEFEHDGRRTRQLSFQQAGRRWTVACSAPSEAFDSYRWRFGEALAAFRVSPLAKPAPQKKERPAKQEKERKAY